MKKICVDESRCICCGACFSTDPEHFTLGENDKSKVISNENLESTNLQNAIEFCPTAAISIVEEENCESDDKNKGQKCCDENCESNNECNDEECNDENCECDNECNCNECHCHKEE